MSKIVFKYKKEDGSVKERIVMYPKYVKEAYNTFPSINEKTSYLQGYEILKENITEEQVKLYEEAIKDYFDLAVPKIEDYLRENNLDPKNISYKTFKKSNIEDLQIL